MGLAVFDGCKCTPKTDGKKILTAFYIRIVYHAHGNVFTCGIHQVVKIADFFKKAFDTFFLAQIYCKTTAAFGQFAPAGLTGFFFQPYPRPPLWPRFSPLHPTSE